jgi:hypothetical protein
MRPEVVSADRWCRRRILMSPLDSAASVFCRLSVDVFRLACTVKKLFDIFGYYFVMNFGQLDDPADVINCSNFFHGSVKGLLFYKVLKMAICYTWRPLFIAQSRALPRLHVIIGKKLPSLKPFVRTRRSYKRAGLIRRQISF